MCGISSTVSSATSPKFFVLKQNNASPPKYPARPFHLVVMSPLNHLDSDAQAVVRMIENRTRQRNFLLFHCSCRCNACSCSCDGRLCIHARSWRTPLYFQFTFAFATAFVPFGDTSSRSCSTARRMSLSPSTCLWPAIPASFFS